MSLRLRGAAVDSHRGDPPQRCHPEEVCLCTRCQVKTRRADPGRRTPWTWDRGSTSSAECRDFTVACQYLELAVDHKKHRVANRTAPGKLFTTSALSP
jgi:hypothetical protein